MLCNGSYKLIRLSALLLEHCMNKMNNQLWEQMASNQLTIHARNHLVSSIFVSMPKSHLFITNPVMNDWMIKLINE